MKAAAGAPIRVLVVEVDAAVRAFLAERLARSPQLALADAVTDAATALAWLQRHRADVVLMGHHPPRHDGFETTRRIMETRPLPIVMSAAAAEADAVFRAMEAGAVACVERPVPGAPGEAAVAHLLMTLRLMSEVRVVTRRSADPARARAAVAEPAPIRSLVGIGASTGGPPVLQTILSALPVDFALPILVVQHIARGFVGGMADWLRQTCGLKVQLAAYGVLPQPGHVYLAPDDFQMTLGRDGRIALSRPVGERGLCPSVDALFGSMAEHCAPQSVGVLLTGMGKDGAAELKRLRDAGAVTIVQDRASAAVYGMPGEAVELGAAVHVLTPEQIADRLIALALRPAGSARP